VSEGGLPAASVKSKKEREKAEKEREKAEKAEKAEKMKRDHPPHHHGTMDRFKNSGKSLRHPKWLGGKERERGDTSTATPGVMVVEEPAGANGSAAPEGTEDLTQQREANGLSGLSGLSGKKERKAKHKSVFFGLRKKPSSVAVTES
jgi:hypothetical protein